MFREDLHTRIKEYAKNKESGGVTIPEIQAEFNLPYKEVVSIVHKLCEENFLSLSGDGLQYVVCGRKHGLETSELNNKNASSKLLRRLESNSNIDELFDKAESGIENKSEKNFRRALFETNFYKRMEEVYTAKILVFCIEEKEISLSSVEHEFHCGFANTNMILNKMLVKGYLLPVRRGNDAAFITKYSKERCLEEFGDKYPTLFNKKEGTEELLKRLNERLAHPFYLRVTKKYMPQSYTSMFTAKFDMQTAISQVPDLNKKVEDFIKRAQSDLSIFGGEWNSSITFEGMCIDVIEKIVGMNKQWQRMDAVKEAAMELAAVDFTKQVEKVLSIHSRVLYELLDGLDEDYELIRKKLWDDY